MTFLAAGRLWLLAAVAALAVCYVLLQRRRQAYAVRFTELDLLASVAPRRPGWRRHVAAVLFLLLLSSLTVAWARPQAARTVARDRATIVVALDVSNSMRAVDVSPDRISAAKRAAVDFVAGLPEGLQVGLVAFDGTARAVVAPTADHAAVSDSIGALALGPGTAIGEAVYTSLAAVNDAAAQRTDGAGARPAPTRVVLLSDGGNTTGRSIASAAGAATAAGVPVSTIAYGTPDGVVDIQGRTIPVPADVAALRTLADSTGGRAYTAASGDELRAVYADIGTQVGTTVERREIGDVFVGIGLLLGALGAAASMLWFARLP